MIHDFLKDHDGGLARRFPSCRVAAGGTAASSPQSLRGFKIIREQREDSCSNLHLSPTLFLTASPAPPPSPLITLILKAASP